MSEIQTESRKALRELIDLLGEVDTRWASAEWNLANESDVVNAHRALMHMLEGGLVGMFESDPTAPSFRRIVTPSRKFTGDNADAIYFDAPVSPAHSYWVRGEINGSCYVSLTVEIGTEDGSLAARTGGVINDSVFEVDAEGRFEVFLGGPERPKNWLPLPEGASRITTRHYFEEQTYAAANPEREPRMRIECLDGPGAPAPPNDEAVAAGIRRVATFVRSRSLDMVPMAQREQPPFVSIVPNQFPAPVVPGDFGLAAFDCAYSMAPFVHRAPTTRCVLRGRWPTLPLRQREPLERATMQTFDFANRQRVVATAHRRRLDDDGRLHAWCWPHRDPGPAQLDRQRKADRSAWSSGASCSRRVRSKRRSPRSCPWRTSRSTCERLRPGREGRPRRRGRAGMGRATVLALAQAGAAVAVLDAERERAEHVAGEVEALGVHSLALCEDVTTAAGASRGVAAAREGLGRLEAVVNIVGASTWAPLLELDEATWERQFAVNLKHHWYVGRSAAQAWIDAGEPGVLCVVGSVSGLFSAANHAAYGAAKAGLLGLVRSAAEEWWPQRIRVNAVVPGAVRTPRIEAAWADGSIPKPDEDTLARMAQPEDVAGPILFLVSDLARRVTGQAVLVDGGSTTKFPYAAG